jgi:hypothetical protein
MPEELGLDCADASHQAAASSAISRRLVRL